MKHFSYDNNFHLNFLHLIVLPRYLIIIKLNQFMENYHLNDIHLLSQAKTMN